MIIFNVAIIKEPKAIGIGSSLTAIPSHTTGDTGPYPAIRLVRTATDKFICSAGLYSSGIATDISSIAAICR